MSNNENNKDKGFSQGVTLIIIGVIFTLITLFDFDINWHVMVRLWPLLLIIIGVCIMPVNKWIRLALTVVLLAVGALIYQQKINDESFIDKIELKTRSHHRIIINDDDDFDD